MKGKTPTPRAIHACDGCCRYTQAVDNSPIHHHHYFTPFKRLFLPLPPTYQGLLSLSLEPWVVLQAVFVSPGPPWWYRWKMGGLFGRLPFPDVSFTRLLLFQPGQHGTRRPANTPPGSRRFLIGPQLYTHSGGEASRLVHLRLNVEQRRSSLANFLFITFPVTPLVDV